MLTRTNPKNGESLPALGFGAMRLTSGTPAAEAKSIALVRDAIEGGATYFDTAFVYDKGKNEVLLGKALAGGYRARAQIATKMPPYMVGSLAGARKILALQLERLQTDRIDYYLLHMLMDKAMFDRLADLGIMAWLEEQKARGVIGHIGFSFHGTKAAFEELIAAYPWDIVQIQYNYLDEHNQATRSGLRLAARLGIPVVVMEPLRGGQLVNHLPGEVLEAFAEARPGWTPAEWAMRWLWNQPEVTVALSGMTEPEQLAENLRIAADTRPDAMSDADLAVYERVKEILLAKTKVPCTSCGYCMPCPFGVDIPGCFANYNDKYRMNLGSQARFKYAQSLGAFSARPGFASRCTECGACEKHCPQRIPIISDLKRVAKDLEGPLFRPFVGLARTFLCIRKPKAKAKG